MNPIQSEKVQQYEYRDVAGEVLWARKIFPVPDSLDLADEATLVSNFAHLLRTGRLAEMRDRKLETKSNLQKEFTENVKKLDQEVTSLSQLTQNLCTLTIDKTMSPNYPKKVVDREKTGIRMVEIRVAQGAASAFDHTESVIGLRDLRATLRHKAAVTLQDHRQNHRIFEAKKRTDSQEICRQTFAEGRRGSPPLLPGLPGPVRVPPEV